MGILSENVLKVTLSLKPDQPGMTENQGLCSKARWVAPKKGEVIPAEMSLFISA